MKTRSVVATLCVALASAAQAPFPQGLRDWQSGWGTATPYARVHDLALARDAALVATGAGFDLRAIDLRNGTVRWQAHSGPGTAAAIVAGHDRVLAGGSVEVAGQDSDWFVGAWSAADGSPLWQDRFDHRGLGDGVRDLAVAGERLFAVGQVSTYLRYGAEYRVRAYDATTGAVLWDDLRATGGNDAATHVVASGDGVWVLGSVAPRTIPDLFLRAYDAASGSIRWSRRIDIADELPTGLALLGNRLGVTAEAGGAWLVQARAADDGRRLWQDLDADALQPIGVVAARGMFIVAGTLRTSTGFEMLTRAYDAATGSLRWVDRYEHPGPSHDVHASAIARHRGAVVVAGTIYDPWPYGHAIRVRGLDVATGNLRWEYGYDVPGADDEATAVAALRNRLVVGGLSHPFDSASSALLLGYRTPRQARTGGASKTSGHRASLALDGGPIR